MKPAEISVGHQEDGIAGLGASDDLAKDIVDRR